MLTVCPRVSPLFELFESVSETTTPAEFGLRVAKIDRFDPCEVPCDAYLEKKYVDSSLISVIIEKKNTLLLQHVLTTYGSHLAGLQAMHGSPLRVCF